MGAAESTPARSNRTTEAEEDGSGPENNTSGGGGGSSLTTVAKVGAGVTIAAAAWGISKLLSNSNNTDVEYSQQRSPHHMILEGANAQSCRIIGWSPPPPQGRFKMNTDGNCSGPSGKFISPHVGELGESGFGGVLRDHNGNWVRGFKQYIGVTDSLTCEFRGILAGLEFLDKHKIKGAILENDCEFAIKWVNRRDDDWGKRAIIRNCRDNIERCRYLIDKNDIKVEHIDGKYNRCADKLADMAIKARDKKYAEIKDLPSELKDLIEKDRYAILYS